MQQFNLKHIARTLGYGLAAACLCICAQAFSAEEKAPKNKPSPPFPTVKFETSLGPFVVELYPKDAPETVSNFLRYVDDGFYAGTTFHRIVPNFVVQAGGYTYEFQRKETRAPIKNEADNDLHNTLGTLSMARTSDPNSATSQFFINLKYNESLDFDKKNNPGYAVFGKVIEGMDTVKKIEQEPRGLYRSHPEAPNYPVIIEKAYRLDNTAPAEE